MFSVSFSPFRHADETPAHAKRNLDGSDPVSTFGRRNRTNTRVAPAQIEVFVRGLFAGLISAVQCSTEPCGGAQVNGTAIFTGEHSGWSCVHPAAFWLGENPISLVRCTVACWRSIRASRPTSSG